MKVDIEIIVFIFYVFEKFVKEFKRYLLSGIVLIQFQWALM